MPSTAEELAALTRNNSARRSGSRNQGLLSRKEVVIGLSCLLPRPEPSGRHVAWGWPGPGRLIRVAALAIGKNTLSPMPQRGSNIT
jgi:hypothetical protein